MSLRKLFAGSVLFLFLVMPTASHARTQAETDALIQSLREQIAILLAQQAGTSTTSSAGITCPSLTYNLYFGLSDTNSGGDVTKLQRFLAQDPTIYPEAKVTGYFGPATELAVQRFQARKGIVSKGDANTTGYGAVGPSTRAAIAARCGGGTPAVSVVTPSTPISTLNAASCTYASDSTGVAQGINFSASGTATKCKSLCTSIRNEKWGMEDSGMCVYTNAKGKRTEMVINGSDSSDSIKVTVPNGGEQWELGVMNTVTWTPYQYSPDINPSKDVVAYLERNDGKGGPEGFTTLGKVQENGKASIHWYAGELNAESSGGNYVKPGQYYIRVVNKKTGAWDRSDRPFTILPRSVDLKLNGSDGPIETSQGQAITASWNAVGASSCVLYNAYDTAAGYDYVGGKIVATTGSRQVYVPSIANWQVSISCQKPDGTYVYDYVSTNQESQKASVKISNPNGGERINPSEQLDINFTSTGLKSASIALYKNDQWKYWIKKDVSPSAKDLDNVLYIWTPSDFLAGLGEGDNAGAIFKIYVTGQKADGTGYIDDKSDSAFAFTSSNTTTPAPTCNMYASNASITLGETVTISWTSKNATSVSVKGGGEVNDYFHVTPTDVGTKTYDATFSGPGGQTTCSASFEVVAPASYNSPAERGAAVVGVYQSSNATVNRGYQYQPDVSQVDEYHPEGTITVNVQGDRGQQRDLVLTSYEPVNWVLNVPSYVTITKIIVTGYHASRVTNVPAGTQVEYHSYDTDGQYNYAYQYSGDSFNNLKNWIKSMYTPSYGSGGENANYTFPGYSASSIDVYVGYKG